MPSSVPSQPASDSDRLLAAILALLVAQRESAQPGPDDRKTEVILSDAGLSPAEIAAVMGKSLAAVRKTLQRAK